MTPRKALLRNLPIHELTSRYTGLVVRWMVDDDLSYLEWIEMEYIALEMARRVRKLQPGRCSCAQCSAWLEWARSMTEGRPSGD